MEPSSVKTITARTVTLEVTDEATGLVFRRELPIDYRETSNFLRLGGEDAEGNPTALVFLSRAGRDHLIDMTGGGADHDSCGTHEHE